MTANPAGLYADARSTAMDVLAYRLSGRPDYAESHMKRRTASVRRSLAAWPNAAHLRARWQAELERTMRSPLAIEQAAARAGIPMPREAAHKGRRGVRGDDG